MTYRIGELSTITGEARKTLRYWTDQELLTAERSPANYRLYGPEAVRTVAFIRSAQAAGFKLRDIKDLLRLASGDQRPCRDVKALARERLADVRRQLEQLRTFETTLTSLVTTPETTCPGETCTFLPNF